jgi:hypothetical protein
MMSVSIFGRLNVRRQAVVVSIVPLVVKKPVMMKFCEVDVEDDKENECYERS